VRRLVAASALLEGAVRRPDGVYIYFDALVRERLAPTNELEVLPSELLGA
jgi:hypothetical protein